MPAEHLYSVQVRLCEPVPEHSPFQEHVPQPSHVVLSHCVPLGLFGYTQLPEPGSQLPEASRHGLPGGSLQVFGVPDTHEPAWHASPIVHALPSSHVLPQTPQFGSAFKSASHPLAALPSQSSQPGSQPVITHWPDWHAVEAWARVQLHPHWLGTPPEPHSSPLGQAPQSMS